MIQKIQLNEMKMISCWRNNILKSVVNPNDCPDYPDCSETGKLAYETIKTEFRIFMQSILLCIQVEK